MPTKKQPPVNLGAVLVGFCGSRGKSLNQLSVISYQLSGITCGVTAHQGLPPIGVVFRCSDLTDN